MRLCVFLLLIICSNYCYSQFQVAGDAVDIGSDCYRITNNSQNQAGSFWYNSTVDLNYPFVLNFDAYFGCPFIFVDGGDGIAFVMQDTGPNLAPLGGGSLGYGGIANSIAIEFDTYSNNTIGDPSFDHVSVQQNGDISHNSTNCLVSPVPIDNNNPNIEDCNYHSFTVTWDPVSNKLELFYNDAVSGSCYSVFSYLGDIVNNIFNGNSFVYWGFTGSTGSATNNQEVCVNSYENWNLEIENQYLCVYDSVVVSNNYDLNNVSWFNSNNVLLSSNDSVLLYGFQNETYYYNYSDFCNSISFDQNFDLIISDPFLVEDTSQQIDISCFGLSDGQISVNVSNGFNPYVFSVNGSSFHSNNTFNNIDSTFNNIVVLDSLGCSDSIQVNLFEPSEIVVSLSNVLNVQCDSFSSGNIDVNVTGGEVPYYFQWNGPNGYSAQSQNISGLNIGSYNLLVTDINGCNSQVFNHVVSFNNDVSIDSTYVEDPLCFNENNGFIDINISGGSSPYSYQWSGPGNFFSFDEDLYSLSSGNYSLIVQDINGCFIDTVISLVNPLPLDFSYSKNNILCNGDFTGEIYINPLGGTAPYNYFWSNSSGFQSSSQNITNVGFGSYDLILNDSNGCNIDTSFFINQPDLLTINLDSLSDVSCFGDSDGFLQVNIEGGIPPYYYQWVGPNGFNSSSLMINNLFAGNYNLTVTDDNNCNSVYQQDIVEINEIVVDIIEINNVSCRGDFTGSIELNVLGGSGPYSFWWGSDSFTSTDQNINNVMAGLYSLVVTDDNMCERNFEFTIEEPEESLEANVYTTDACLIGDLGNAVLDVSGGGGNYDFDWFGYSPNSLLPGSYQVLITDDLGCSVLLDYNIDSNPQPQADFNIESLIHVNENIQFINLSKDYSYSNWDFGDSMYSYEENPWHNYNNEGSYLVSLVVSNIFGCIDSVIYEISVFDDIYICIPDAFTPNGDGVNDIFNIPVINYDDFDFSIYSRNGQQIFYSNNPDYGWDGKYNNNMCPIGEYSYIIKVLDIFGKEYLKKGTILLCE